ncbi:MAG: CRISPR-associated endonuclease Cas1 [Thermomicrobiales bacterium]
MSDDIVTTQGVLVLTGYGLHVGVERGHLVWSDGIGRNRRSGKLNRATSDLKRLVVLGHAGTISFEALRWLHDIGASFVQFDADGTVIVAKGPCGLDDARLRRAQALAATNGIGVSIGRSLLESKVDGQHALLARIPGSEPFQAAILQARDQLATATEPATMRLVEAQAANAYWAAWSSQPIRFAKRDAALVPVHWLTFGQRRSEITGRSRLASNPINALLNYLYAILETEVRLAILAMGLDPGMGIIHADQKSRDSFVFDLIEPLRPQADGYLLTLLQDRTFTAKEFFETREGVCRLVPPLSTSLAEASPLFAKLAAPLVEKVAYRLGRTVQEAGKPLTVPTLLTQANRSEGRATVRVNPPKQARSGKISTTTACRECGVVLSDSTKHYCDECLPTYRDAHTATFSAAGRAKMAELRAAGKDPSAGGKNAEIRAAKLKERWEAQREWDAEGVHADPEVFRREILPAIQGVSLTELARVTGLSVQYCGLIRRGLKMPHPRHWESLRSLSLSHSSLEIV